MSYQGVVTVNLAAIQANWRYAAAQLGIGSECAAVIKANAYGLGADKVSQALLVAGCRHYFVASVKEALALPDNVIVGSKVYILGGVAEGGEQDCAAAGFIPVLSSIEQVREWSRVVDKKSSCAIKFDTGMTRLGLLESDRSELLKLLRQQRLSVDLFLSHLSAAEDSPEISQQQLQRFNIWRELLRAAYSSARFSLANSAGIFLGQDYHFDLVRPGAFLYGYALDVRPAMVEASSELTGSQQKTSKAEPVVSLRLPIRQIKTTSEKAQVGYGAAAVVDTGTRLAVLQGGYADGLQRTAGVELKVDVNGVLLPIVGRMSMDLTTIDVSAVEPGLLSEGDYVDVLNINRTVNRVTLENGSLGYEVLTSLGDRYRYDYVG